MSTTVEKDSRRKGHKLLGGLNFQSTPREHQSSLRVKVQGDTKDTCKVIPEPRHDPLLDGTQRLRTHHDSRDGWDLSTEEGKSVSTEQKHLGLDFCVVSDSRGK